MKLPTIEELAGQLETARQKAEATDAAILNSGSEIDPQVLSDLEARFTEETQEVGRISAAIERRSNLDTALKAVPRGETGSRDTPSPRATTREPLTYRKPSEGGKYSFFQDLYRSKFEQDFGATARLQRHQREMAVEFRNDLTTVATDGGEFVPPQHLQSDWAQLARAGRVFANAIGSRPIPATGMSFTIPKVTGGATTALQTTQNTAVSETDPVTAEITLTVRTIAGQVDLSRQSFERSDPGLDDVVGEDLANSYAVTLDTHIINHATDGILNNANINAVTFTTPVTVAGFYPKLADAIQRIHTLRFMSPDAIFMHPRRWAWILASLDSSSRPLVTPYAPQNAVAGFGGVVAEGAVGNMQGLNVYVDANIPVLGGASTTEDAVIVTRLADNRLYESPTPRVRVYEETLSGELTVRIQVYGYLAYTSDRYGKAHSKITGAGLVAPTF